MSKTITLLLSKFKSKIKFCFICFQTINSIIKLKERLYYQIIKANLSIKSISTEILPVRLIVHLSVSISFFFALNVRLKDLKFQFVHTVT